MIHFVGRTSKQPWQGKLTRPFLSEDQMIEYHCNKCKKDQTTIIKDIGSFFCPSCSGIIMVLVPELEENVITRKLEETNKTLLYPVTNLRSLRKAIKKGMYRVL
jgi:DNA-directed RNA polymerase subunit RPC12/RpoP